MAGRQAGRPGEGRTGRLQGEAHESIGEPWTAKLSVCGKG